MRIFPHFGCPRDGSHSNEILPRGVWVHIDDATLMSSLPGQVSALFHIFEHNVINVNNVHRVTNINNVRMIIYGSIQDLA